MRGSTINWPLLGGALLVSLLLVIAVWGPALAPKDPLIGDATIHLNGRVYGPQPLRPLGPFVTRAYPLGIDTVGRDQWSRLLWAVRPTLLLCAAVVAARMLAGVAVGLAAGWWAGRAARMVDPLLSACMAVPLLIIAIPAILMVGIQRGIIAFVIALSITGWADVAQLVKARTESVRSAPYIEAAHAIGLAPAGIVWRHVLPQLSAILPLLLAFEMSAVLLIVAELGYVGFFIGGGFLYAPVDADSRPLLTAGSPELGQMLSQFFGLLNRTPWVAISAGMLVFAALAGFTLLGEGFRRRLDITRVRRRSWWPLQRRQPRADGLPGTVLVVPAAPMPAAVRSIAIAAGVAVLLYTAWRGPQVPASVLERRAAELALASMQARLGAAAGATAPLDMPSSAGAAVAALTGEPVDPASIQAAALEPALFQINDLPAGYGASNFRPRVPAALGGVPPPGAAATAQLDFNGLNNGRVTALFYASTAERDAAYDMLATAQSSVVPLPSDMALPTLGERTMLAQNWSGDVVVFARCGVVVQLNAAPLSTQAGPRSADEMQQSFEIVLRYAQNLDLRLSALACTAPQ